MSIRVSAKTSMGISMEIRPKMRIRLKMEIKISMEIRFKMGIRLKIGIRLSLWIRISVGIRINTGIFLLCSAHTPRLRFNVQIGVRVTVLLHIPVRLRFISRIKPQATPQSWLRIRFHLWLTWIAQCSIQLIRIQRGCIRACQVSTQLNSSHTERKCIRVRQHIGRSHCSHQCNLTVFNSGATSFQQDHQVVKPHSSPAFCDPLVRGHAYLPIIQNPAMTQIRMSR